MRSGLMAMEKNRAGTSLSEGSYSQKPVFLSLLEAPGVSLCTQHTQRGQESSHPSMVMHDHPARNLSPCFPLVQCPQEHSAFQVTLNPLLGCEGPA